MKRFYIFHLQLCPAARQLLQLGLALSCALLGGACLALLLAHPEGSAGIGRRLLAARLQSASAVIAFLSTVAACSVQERSSL